jgi:hypothetical protein
MARSSPIIELMFESRSAPPLSINQDVPADWPVRLKCAEAPRPTDPSSTHIWTALVQFRSGRWEEATIWAWSWTWTKAEWRCQVEVGGVTRWYHYDSKLLCKVARRLPVAL